MTPTWYLKSRRTIDPGECQNSRWIYFWRAILWIIKTGKWISWKKDLSRDLLIGKNTLTTFYDLIFSYQVNLFFLLWICRRYLTCQHGHFLGHCFGYDVISQSIDLRYQIRTLLWFLRSFQLEEFLRRFEAVVLLSAFENFFERLPVLFLRRDCFWISSW